MLIITSAWRETPCSLLDVHRRFGASEGEGRRFLRKFGNYLPKLHGVTYQGAITLILSDRYSLHKSPSISPILSQTKRYTFSHYRFEVRVNTALPFTFCSSKLSFSF